jgi:hypothetical protein
LARKKWLQIPINIITIIQEGGSHVLDPDARREAKARLRVILGEKGKGQTQSRKKSEEPKESLQCQLDMLQRKAGVLNIAKSMSLPELLKILQADKLGFFDKDESDS